MSAKAWSMIISILLVGLTLMSLGIAFLNYKDDIKEFNKQEEIRQEKQAEETRAKEEEVGHMVVNFTPEDFDLNPTRDLDSEFKTKLTIHFVIMGFIILSEIGLLIVLPNGKNNLKE